ncbi:hypothetical protein GE278_17495 [Enterobacteriaceae bacterium Kacie_13]|nr:hypothetical protein GE278_17495 [Enterobacteriaceae bacterium Kacie_13]
MSQSDTRLHQLIRWVHDNRAQSMRLNVEADGLLARLIRLQQRQQQIASLREAPLTLGFYGSSVAGKHHLLKMIVAGDGEDIEVQLGGNTLNYLRHINPDNVAPLMAVRFTGTPPPAVENFPLLLTLFNQSELAQRLIRQYHASRQPCITQRSAISATLAALRPRRQPREIPGMNCGEFLTVIESYHQSVRAPHQLDDALVYQMAELAPWLDLADRATLLSTLWGEHATLTSQWQQQAQRLQHLGGVSQVLAPVSLVVDALLLPNPGFLLPATEDERELNNDVIVCPLRDDTSSLRLSIAQQDLASICAEITFTLSHKPVLTAVDIVDIPPDHLPRYQDRLQPDTVLVCNSVAAHEALSPVAKTLSRWIEETQPQGQNTLPGLVWAITPFDLRFTHGNHTDDAVQRFITRSGQCWGTLQALDHRDMSCLNDWLSAAVSTPCREDRLTALREDLQQQITAQFSRFSTPHSAGDHTPPEQLIRALQAQAAKHGYLINQLMLPRDTLAQCWLQQSQKEVKQPAGLLLSVDLFADTAPAMGAVQQPDSFATQVFTLWVNHLTQLSHNRAAADATGLTAAMLRRLCEELITTAFRLGLNRTLEKTLANQDDVAAMAVTHAGNIFSDFVTWLGYNSVAIENRPASRINQGNVIFAPATQANASARLDRLGEEVIQGNAKYIYDWLVALLSRATENREHPCPEDINVQQREALLVQLSEKQ